MIRFRCCLALVLPALASILCAPAAAAFQLAPGDLYTANYQSRTISQYTPDGVYEDALTLPPELGSELRGLAFGPDGLLYAVTVQGSGFDVVVLDGSGGVRATYHGSEYVHGTLNYGKINFATNGQFFVTGQDHLVAFTPGSPDGTVVYTNDQVHDVAPLPSGNLLVICAYELQEITTTGSVVRTITPDVRLVNACSVEYDPTTNCIFVTMLGTTGLGFQLMRLDGASGEVTASVTFRYADDMILTLDRRLVVGSRTEVPEIFDLDLNQVGSLTGGQQMYVTQMPPLPAPPVSSSGVPTLAPWLAGLFALLILAAGVHRLR